MPSVWRNVSPFQNDYKSSVVNLGSHSQVICFLQVSMAEFMTDEDLEAMKTDVNAERLNTSQDPRPQVC